MPVHASCCTLHGVQIDLDALQVAKVGPDTLDTVHVSFRSRVVLAGQFISEFIIIPVDGELNIRHHAGRLTGALGSVH